MTYFYIKNAILLSVIVSLLGACARSESENPDEIIDIAISPQELLITQLNTQVQLSILAKNRQGSPIRTQPAFVWTSSAPDIVSVNRQGTLLAHGIGRATITASIDQYVRSSEIEVNTSNRVITGIIRYEDREYGRISRQPGEHPIYGFIEDKYKPVRYVLVDLLDKEGVILDSTSTNVNGEYAFRTMIPSIFSVRALAQSNDIDVSLVSVNDLSGSLYAYEKSGEWLSTTQNIDIPTQHLMAGVFNIVDVYVSAAAFVKTSVNVFPPALSAYWEQNSGKGTYFCVGRDSFNCVQGDGIYILNLPDKDTDEFDDDVLLHEYGHFFANALSKDDSPGGCHQQTDNDLDLRLAWSEGWGNFFTVAVKRWMAETNVSALSASSDYLGHYIDTDGQRHLIAFAVEAPDARPPFFYASNESAVAKILTQIRDDSALYDILWQVVTDFKTENTENVVNLERFWDGFLTAGITALQQSQLEAIFAERHVFYMPDLFEEAGDNEVSAFPRITPFGVDETHTLYRQVNGKDVDLIAFQATEGKTYQLKTFNLSNGADTKLRLLDANNTPVVVNGAVVENDNGSTVPFIRPYNDGGGARSACSDLRPFNDATTLASSITYTADVSELLFVEVSTVTSLSYSKMTGRYGSYSISIQEQQ